MYRNSKAFTLIELLVVIAIIAILAAILFPVFAQAKLAAKKTQDLSNMKQISLGLIMYSGDSDDVLPLSQFWDSNTGYENAYLWSSKLCVQPYLKNLDIYKNPVDSIPNTHDAAYYGMDVSRTPKPLSYMPNAITPAYYMFGVDNPQGLMPVQSVFPPYANGSATSVSSAANPSKIIMLAGGYAEYYKDIWGCGEWNQNEIPWCYSASGLTEQWVVDLLRLSVPGDPYYNAWRKFSGGSNFSFGDGSAKQLKPGELGDPGRWIINPPEGS